MAAPTTAMLTSFKVELFKAVHNFSNPGGHSFKAALYKAAASVAGSHGAADTNYSSMGSDELAAGSGYTAGGAALTSVTPVASSTAGVCDFNDVSWSSASFTTSGCMIYNTSASNAGCGNHSFGGDQSVSSGTFTIVWPTPDSSNAILRIT